MQTINKIIEWKRSRNIRIRSMFLPHAFLYYWTRWEEINDDLRCLNVLDLFAKRNNKSYINEPSMGIREILESLPKLHQLMFEHPNNRDSINPSLDDCNKQYPLKDLEYHGNGMSNVHHVSVLSWLSRHCRTLRSLTYHCDDPNKTFATFLDHIQPLLPTLQTIAFVNTIKAEESVEFEDMNVGHCLALQTLSVADGNHCSVRTVTQLLASCASCRVLKTLILAELSDDVSEEKVVQLCGTIRTPLQSLQLGSWCPDSFFTSLDILPLQRDVFRSVTSLHLQNCMYLTGESLIAIATYMSSLETLKICECTGFFGPDVLHFATHAVCMNTLHTVQWISNDNVEDDAMICFLLHCHRLQSLALEGGCYDALYILVEIVKSGGMSDLQYLTMQCASGITENYLADCTRMKEWIEIMTSQWCFGQLRTFVFSNGLMNKALFHKIVENCPYLLRFEIDCCQGPVDDDLRGGYYRNGQFISATVLSKVMTCDCCLRGADILRGQLDCSVENRKPAGLY